MSTLGAQEAIVTVASGEWELIGRDMIRTKRTADGGGMIVAQFWTSPAPEHAALMVAAPDMCEALNEAQLAISYAMRGTADPEQADKYGATIRKIAAALAKAGA